MKKFILIISCFFVQCYGSHCLGLEGDAWFRCMQKNSEDERKHREQMQKMEELREIEEMRDKINSED